MKNYYRPLLKTLFKGRKDEIKTKLNIKVRDYKYFIAKPNRAVSPVMAQVRKGQRLPDAA